MSSTQLQASSDVAFDFVRSLACELSSGKIDLPSFPEVALQVRKVLADPDASLARVVRVVGSEPALAARLIRIANASFINRTGKPITELRTAINRIGYSMVRSAAMAVAISQMRRGAELDRLQDRLNLLWRESTQIAALSYVLARHCSAVNPDEAMLAGLMHGLGKLYILTRGARHPELFIDDAILEEVIASWHAPIAKAILENWEFPAAMCEAVGEQADPRREGDAAPDLRDVIAIAIVMACYSADVSAAQIALENMAAGVRLGLDASRIHVVLEKCAAEVAALSEAFGG